MECRKYMQVAVNGVLTLPDHIPDIDFILRVTSTPIIDNAVVIDKQVSFSGHILICTEMVSSTPECPQLVHFASFETPFIGLIDHYYARTGMDVQLGTSIKHQDFRMLSPRCINKLIVVKICILRLMKSCKPQNAHCSEPRLTLLSKPCLPQTCSAVKPLITPPIHPTDFHNEPTDCYLPKSLHHCGSEHCTHSPCTICGGKIDP